MNFSFRLEGYLRIGITCVLLNSFVSYPFDTGPTSDVTFQPSQVTRTKITATNLLFTLQSKLDLAQLGISIVGTSSALHVDETKPDNRTAVISGVKAGQKSQIPAMVVSVPGQTGKLTITARGVNPGFNVTAAETDIPFQNRNGQLKLAQTKPNSGNSPVAVSVKTGDTIRSDGYIVTGQIKIALKGILRIPQDQFKITVTAEGVTLVSKGDEKPEPPGSDPLTRTITFAAVDGQKGRIITEAAGRTAEGKPYVRRSYLYVLADPTNVYTSTSGFVDLEIQRLRANLAAKSITQEEYATRMNAILSGASETGRKQ
jgi:hypothetical protein